MAVCSSLVQSVAATASAATDSAAAASPAAAALLVDSTDNPQPLLLLRIRQHIATRVPADDTARLVHIDFMHHLARLHVCNLDLLLVLVVTASGNVAPVKAKVDALDGLFCEIKRPHADPLLRVPKRDERVAAARRQVLARRRHGDGVARGRVGVEGQCGRQGGVVGDLDAAVPRREEEVGARPVEDTLVRLPRLAVLGDGAQGGAVDGDEDIVLAQVSILAVDVGAHTSRPCAPRQSRCRPGSMPA